MRTLLCTLIDNANSDAHMARIDLIVALIRAGVRADVEGVRSAAEAIANEEERRGHQGVVQRIRAAMGPHIFDAGSTPATPHAEGILFDLPARQSLQSLKLDPTARSDLELLIKEQKQRKKLVSKGFEPRHRLLLSGPPGNGKTSVAEALAHDLGLPFKVVSYGGLIGSLLGETNRRIEALFAQASSEPCVLFFDEFEAVGKERADRQEAGEMKRAVATLLIKIDSLPSSVVVVAATNHPEMLDRAVWRRFQVKLELNSPSTDRAINYFVEQLGIVESRYLTKFFEECLSGVSYAELRDFTLDVRRRSIIESLEVTQALREQVLLRFPTVDWPLNDPGSYQAAPPPKSSSHRRKTDGKAAGPAGK